MKDLVEHVKDLMEQVPFLIFLAFVTVVFVTGWVLVRRRDGDRRAPNEPLTLRLGEDFVEVPHGSSPHEVKEILMAMQQRPTDVARIAGSLKREE